jgi:predicted transcriptional regulator of viral defense system
MQNFQGVDPALAALLKRTETAVLDYGFVMSCLKEYSYPRKKVSDLIKKGALIQIKKGLYIIHPSLSRYNLEKETLANMMYGPSYVSLEWACQYYRLIPERVTTITSITTKRSKQFQTPIGVFTYDHIKAPAYSTGITQRTFTDGSKALIATKEKALTDLLILRRGRCSSSQMMREILFEDYRIEMEDLRQLRVPNLKKIHEASPHSATHYLLKLLEKGQSHE